MTIQVLVSTMNQKDYTLLDKMRIGTDAIVVNQCGADDMHEFTHNGHKVKWINSSTRGLSISRNICLKYATGDICLVADDDLEYIDGYENIVSSEFEKNKDADIIRFQVEGIEKSFKKYPQKKENIGFFKSLKISSVELAFKLERISGIWFDELIGAGTKYRMGEENAFLVHCLSKKLRIIYTPRKISRLHIGESSWKNITPELYLMGRGAAFEAMGTRLTHLLILQFAFRKRKRYELPIIQQIKLMEFGRKEYLKDKLFVCFNNH